MAELKPCPFCGSASFFGDRFPELIDHDIVELYAVECNGCMARGPAKETPEEAEEAWNRRAEDGEEKE